MSLGPGTRAVVIDNGSGFTKAGYAGNRQPDYVFPTAIAAADEGASEIGGSARDGLRDLDFCLGDAALASTRHSVNYPVRHGLIENWTNMERVWQRCFFEHLRCDPEDTYVVLTEPPLNPPENREYTAEVMFETFNVPGLHIGVQAVLALTAALDGASAAERSLTGTVIDSGEGGTHVIPVSDGYVLGGAIRHIPLGGRDITAYVQRSLRERGEAVPPEESMEVARRIKENHCYVGASLINQFERFDKNPAKHFKRLEFASSRGSKATYSVELGYEQFLGPELFFNPEIFSPDFTKPLAEVVDESILQCPVDTRRALYGRVVLSGGSTMFPTFGERLQKDLKSRVKARFAANAAKLKVAPTSAASEMAVSVLAPEFRKYAVWLGGSMMASQGSLAHNVITKQQYMEEGPRCARRSNLSI